jgi:hypothetical protein
MTLDRRIVDQFFRVLVEEIRAHRPEYLVSPFTVAEIYQSLVPYRTHRDRIGVELNGDYEEALMQLLGGDPAYLRLESDPARDRIRGELASKNPNTGIFREYAALSVRLSSERISSMGIDAEAEGEPGAEAGNAETGSGTASPGGSTPSTPTSPGPGGLEAAPPHAPPADPPVPGADAGAAPDACPECRTALPQRASVRFCPSCGANVLVVPCSSCGEELERGWSYCVACGTPATG